MRMLCAPPPIRRGGYSTPFSTARVAAGGRPAPCVSCDGPYGCRLMGPFDDPQMEPPEARPGQSVKALPIGAPIRLPRPRRELQSPRPVISTKGANDASSASS